MLFDTRKFRRFVVQWQIPSMRRACREIMVVVFIKRKAQATVMNTTTLILYKPVSQRVSAIHSVW